MTQSRPARTTTRRILAAGLLAVIAVIGLELGSQVLATSPSTAASPIRTHRSHHDGSLGLAGGALPGGTTVFDDEVPGVARLDPALLGALRRAATDAGIRFDVDSGWRSQAYQAQLLREAVSKYGSKEEAARWVATPNTSAHVSGDAVDMGSAAAAWLSEHGGAYGLCRIYANEPWHFELRREPCPPMYADPTHDPRLKP